MTLWITDGNYAKNLVSFGLQQRFSWYEDAHVMSRAFHSCVIYQYLTFFLLRKGADQSEAKRICEAGIMITSPCNKDPPYTPLLYSKRGL